MSDHYELFEVSPSASDEEIQQAFESKYNHWRRLVNHHDPSMANKASQMLQTLEQSRVVLLDHSQRSLYDAAHGFNAVVGGLADPSLAGSLPTPPPPTSGNGPVKPAVPQRVDAWVCEKCQHANEKGAKYCKGCGNEIAQMCPNSRCNTLFEKIATFCPGCGSNPQQFLKQAAEESERAAEQAHIEHVRRIEQQLATAQSYLDKKQYRLSSNALAGFEGLGSETILCPRSMPQWSHGEAIQKQAKSMGNRMLITMLPITVIASMIGAGLWYSNQSAYSVPFDRIMLPILGGGLLGLIAPLIYYKKWGGKRSPNADRIIALISPAVLGVGAVVGVYVIVVVIALWFFGAMFSG